MCVVCVCVRERVCVCVSIHWYYSVPPEALLHLSRFNQWLTGP